MNTTSLIVLNRKRHQRHAPQMVIHHPEHGFSGWVKDESGTLHEYIYCDHWFGYTGWLPIEDFRTRREALKESHRLKRNPPGSLGSQSAVVTERGAWVWP